MNLQDQKWNVSQRKIIKTTLEAEDLDSILHNNLVMKIRDAKAAVDKQWKKLGTIPAWQLEKVKSKKEVVKEAQKNNNKVHFASLMDSCHLKNSELDRQYQKYEGRVALRGGTVKDDSGAYAVKALAFCLLGSDDRCVVIVTAVFHGQVFVRSEGA